MAALSANLLAAAAPPLNPPVSTPSQTLSATNQPATSSFAGVLSQATGTAPEVPANSLELEQDIAGTPAGSELAAAFAAIGLVAPPLPVALPTATAVAAGATSTPAASQTNGIGSPARLPAIPTPSTAANSRSVELQLNTAPAVRSTATQTPAVGLPTQPENSVADGPTPGVPVSPSVERPTTTAPTTAVAATPTEVIRAAARPTAVVPQAPVVVEKSQQLPVQPAEVGYNLVGPTVNETPAVNPVAAVGGTPSQAQVEQLAARLPATEPTTPKNVDAPAATAAGFEPVLAAEAPRPVAVQTPPAARLLKERELRRTLRLQRLPPRP